MLPALNLSGKLKYNSYPVNRQHYLMEKTMRWFGPNDPVSLPHIRQAGCTGIVTALHQIPVGDKWPVEAIMTRKRQIESSGMHWTVIESLPVHEEIKKRCGRYREYIENYKISMRNLASCGVRIITYNFMPILDWIRTDPVYELPSGARTLRFDKNAFTVFDLFLLKRPGAQIDYNDHEKKAATIQFDKMSSEERETLFNNVLLGLPGSDVPFTAKGILNALETYKDIDATALQSNLIEFLKEIVPVVAEFDMQLALHPDDPPFPALGLPRIVSTEQHVAEILESVPTIANGICFCTGSFGVRPDNDLVGMLRRFGDRIHFLHLRNTLRDENGNFREASHLEGDTDMVSIIQEILLLMHRRKTSLPMRPDHGLQILDDLTKKTYPGYTAIGRLKGLAELRGVELAVCSEVMKHTIGKCTPNS